MRRFSFFPFLAIAICASSQGASANSYNWTGLYAGIHLGGAWGKGRANVLSG
jgi:hypothetical protein